MNSNKDFVQKQTDRQRADRVVEPGETTKIPVVEEQLQVQKKVVETGGVRVHKSVEAEDVLVEMPVLEEEFLVERVTINQYVDTAPPAIRNEGNTTIIPVLKEVLVKRLVLVEEVHITKKTVKKQGSAEATLRKEKVTVERIENPQDSTPPSSK